MWAVVEDTVGRHDFLLTPCSTDTFRILYGIDTPRSELPNELGAAPAPFGILPYMIPTTLNVFMNVAISSTGELTIGTPRSRAGDYLLLRADGSHRRCHACSAERRTTARSNPSKSRLSTRRSRRRDAVEAHAEMFRAARVVCRRRIRLHGRRVVATASQTVTLRSSTHSGAIADAAAGKTRRPTVRAATALSHSRQ
jgi:hypothetical protein